jgi:hypothetical protein
MEPQFRRVSADQAFFSEETSNPPRVEAPGRPT